MRIDTKYIFQDLSTVSNNRVHVQVKKDQQVVLVLFAAVSAQYFVEVELIGKHSRADVFGVVIGKKNTQIAIQTLQKHTIGDSISDLLIKAVLFDDSRFFYQGNIRVEKKAQITNSYQRNDNLLLSSGAAAESKPGLEILANDVRCTHGATIGNLDPELLFYLQSRGISHQAAQNMIVSGFFQVILDKIENELIKKQLQAKIFEYLPTI